MALLDQLTEPQQDLGDLPEGPTRRSQPVLVREPAGSAQPGLDVVSAERLGLGHQHPVGGRAVEHLGGEHGGAAQHLHGSAGGGRGGEEPPRTETLPAAVQLRTPPPRERERVGGQRSACKQTRRLD